MTSFQLYAPPHAPFTSQGDLNLDTVERQAESLIRDGISGVFVSGTTGESMSLTVQERLDLAKRWLDVTRSTELRVIVQVGHNAIADAATMAAHAQREGADAVATLAPSFLKPASVEDLIECCAPVAAAAPDLPFYLYDIPVLTNVRLSMSEFLEKASDRIPNLKGLKFTNPDLVELQECLALQDGRFDIMFGCDEILLAGVLFGCDGAVGSTYNFCAPHVLSMIDAFEAGDMATARRKQLESVQLIRTLQSYSFAPAAKAAMNLVGVDCGPVRAPLTNLSTMQKNVLLGELRESPVFSGSAAASDAVLTEA